MTLQQQAVKEISLLSDEDLSQVIQFMNFLRFSKRNNSGVEEPQIGQKKYRERGGLSGSVVLAEDFHETPECFKEYI